MAEEDKTVSSVDIREVEPTADGWKQFEVVVIEDQWISGQWNGLDMLTCKICQWDTLDGLDEAHKRKATCPRCRPAEQKPAATSSIVYVATRWGETREVQQEE